MLYDQVIKGLGSEFIHYKSEIDVPPESQSKWGQSSLRSLLTAAAPVNSSSVPIQQNQKNGSRHSLHSKLSNRSMKSQRRGPLPMATFKVLCITIRFYQSNSLKPNTTIWRDVVVRPSRGYPRCDCFELCLHVDAHGRLPSRTSESILKWCRHPPILRLIFPTVNLCTGPALITQVEVHRTHRLLSRVPS